MSSTNGSNGKLTRQGQSDRARAAQSHLARLARLEESYWSKRAGQPRNSYAAGEASRMNPVPSGIDPLGSDADYHYRTERNYFLMVERGRAAVRNHPLVEQGINRLIANLRLTQIQLDANTGDKDADRVVKAKWREWTESKLACDWEGQRDFHALVAQSFFNQVQDGDILHLPLNTGQLQTWESHHIRNPFGHIATGQSQDGIVHGAEVQNGRTVGYHVTPFSLAYFQSLTRRSDSRYYPVWDAEGNQQVFWAGFTHRFWQRRGISRLSAPRDAMTGFDDLQYAHVKSALRRSLISYLMESNQPAGPPALDGGELPQSGDRYTEDVGLGVESVVVEQLGEAAQVFKAPEGYSLKGWNADMPGSQFFEHASLMLTMLAVNLDLPLMIFLLDGSLVNFHGGRMTWDQTKLRLQELQRHVIATRHWPVYRWKVRQWTTPGSPHFDPELAALANQGIDLLQVKFRPRGWPYVKPLEDAAGEDLAERRNLKSRRSILAERGDDVDEVDDEIIADRASLVRKSIDEALAIVDEYPELGLDTLRLASELRYGSSDPGGVKLTLDAGESATAEVEPPGAGESTDDDER